MTDDLDPESHPIPGPFRLGGPRLARLVQSPGARRFSPRRLIVAGVSGALLLWGGGVAASRGIRGLADWVAQQPEHEIDFASIELVPPPPAYILNGSTTILETVRLDSNRGRTLPLLATDLEALRVDLSRNPWIEQVERLRVSHRRIKAEVAYRKPLAVVLIDTKNNEGIVVDRHGVELPVEYWRFEKIKETQQYHVIGDPRCLIQIREIGHPVPNRMGLVWKSADSAIDDGRILEATGLVQLLNDRIGEKLGAGRAVPDFRNIYFHRFQVKKAGGQVEWRAGFFLQDATDRFVWWGAAPDAPVQDDVSTADKWAMLTNYLAEHGPLDRNLRGRSFLKFTPQGAVVVSCGPPEPVRVARPPGRS